jgi:general nucleoside transport system permease protein
MTGVFLISWLNATVLLAAPILLAAVGELYAERSGVLNLGIQGCLLLGALASFGVAHETGEIWLGVLAGAAAGALCSVPLSLMYVTVGASQVVVGIVFNILAFGLGSYVYRLMNIQDSSSSPMFKAFHIPVLSDIPVLGPILFRHSLLLYLVIAVVAVAHWALYRTHFGLNIRAVGENPKAAEAAGIDVKKMRHIGVTMSGLAAGAAGAYIVLAQIGLFRDNIVDGKGFIALAIVIFGRWDPLKCLFAALAFAAADALQLSLQLTSAAVPAQVLLGLPYIVTILAISGVAGRARQPAALMVPYHKSA